MMSAHEKERLLDEGRRQVQVKHANVVQVFGADERDGRVGLWMELIEGKTLYRLQADTGPLGANEVATIGVDLCRALAAVHGAGLTHGDIKAQNVMRETGGRIVLMDFSTSRMQDEVRGKEETVSGTPLYMAPELFDDEKPTPGTDVYSVGIVLFYLLTGTYPYDARTLDELRELLAAGEPQLLNDLRPELPRDLVRTIMRAIAPRAAERFRTAGALEAALENSLLGGRGIATPGPSAATELEKRIGTIEKVAKWALWLPASAAAITFLGFVTTQVYAMSFGLQGRFAPPGSLSEYFYWGFKLTVPTFFFAIVLGVFWLAFRWLPRSVRTGWERLTATRLAGGFFSFGLLSLFGVFWIFRSLLAAVVGLSGSEPGAVVDFTVLGPSHFDFFEAYSTACTLVVLMLIFGLFAVMRRRRESSVPPALVGMAGICVVVSVLLYVPYRVLWNVNREKVLLAPDDRACYIMAVDREDFLIFCPDPVRPERVVVEESQFRRTGVTEYVFSPLN